MNTLPAGLYAIADSAFGDPVELVERLVDAGCPIIQLRAKGVPDSELLAMAHCAMRVIGTSRLIINDNVDVAAKSGAHGVHLGQADTAVSVARKRLGESAIIGLSTHSIDQVIAASTVDYIGFGSVFETRSKQNPGKPRGPDRLREAVRKSSVPVVAIGGINRTNIDSVRQAGAHGWAIIRALLDANDLRETVRFFQSQP